jgi:hypothetical protein
MNPQILDLTQNTVTVITMNIVTNSNRMKQDDCHIKTKPADLWDTQVHQCPRYQAINE